MSGRSERSIPSPEGTAVALAVSPLSADRVRLREILSQGHWELREASDCCEALALLRDQSAPVLLCERDHADGNWEDLLKATARQPAPPNLIAFSRLADESLWAEVLNLGGFDLLMKPFEPEEVLRDTFAAWSRWECDFVACTVAGLPGNHTGAMSVPSLHLCAPQGYMVSKSFKPIRVFSSRTGKHVVRPIKSLDGFDCTQTSDGVQYVENCSWFV